MARRKGQSRAQAPRPSTPESIHSDETERAVPPLFNTTFSTHRVSPLYIGPQELTQARLDALARRLRDTLVGDVVRGIQIGLEATETPAGQVGPLRAVRMRWFRAEEVLGEVDAGTGPSDAQQRGLWIEIQHENASYVALLLPGYSDAGDEADAGSAAPRWSMQQGHEEVGGGRVDQSRFVHLPLLLLKMPQALKSVVGEWLATTFDCRVTKLHLGTKTLVGVLEGWLRAGGQSDLALTLAFNAPLQEDCEEGDEANSGEAGLKSIEVGISSADLRRFLRVGKTLGEQDGTDEHDEREMRRLAGPHVDDGWAWRKTRRKRGDDGDGGDPFTQALAKYLDRHLALDLFHPGVRVIQVSCGGFVLAQSRVKMVRLGEEGDAARAAWMFVVQLGERVRRSAMQRVTSAG